jgi:hypothetical protein
MTDATELEYPLKFKGLPICVPVQITRKSGRFLPKVGPYVYGTLIEKVRRERVCSIFQAQLLLS